MASSVACGDGGDDGDHDGALVVRVSEHSPSSLSTNASAAMLLLRLLPLPLLDRTNVSG